MRRRVSSHDVAKLAGVSQTTVSLVLNKPPDARFPESTRQRIFAAAKELNYHAHSAATALVTGRTHRIGIVPNQPHHFDIHNAYYHNIMSGIMRGAAQQNYNLLLHAATYTDWNALHQDIMSGAADGVLLIGRGENDSLTKALLDANFPTVCVSYNPGRADAYVVDCDNEMCGELAVTHLLNMGHRSILLLFIDEDNSWTQERLAGVGKTIAANGLTLDTLIYRDMSKVGEWLPDWVDKLIDSIDSSPKKPTAIICLDEFLAQSLTEVLPPRGIRIPEDMALVSFNSSEISARSMPPMTSVFQPLITIGEVAVTTLVNILESRNVEQKVKKFPVQIDIRESSCLKYS